MNIQYFTHQLQHLFMQENNQINEFVWYIVDDNTL